ncbi:MAG TPA: hypothetical protein VNY34_02520 [Solirubrobacteraceae bacterium]|nr:hypothetical protein [Solirubrobacteraceae bacterium]
MSVSELARTVGRRGQRHKEPALSVTYTCDQTATVRITGVVTIAGRTRAGKKTRATNLALAPAKAPATAGKASSPVFLALPPAAVKALNAGRRTTTALSLTVQNANGRSLGTLRLTLVAQSALRRK